MGFLDHSTNNIIVDAVLTDAGRQALARNDGSFNIYQFALGDDEVDYGIIKEFGRTVGKEKIEKNTPVMEALTAGSLGLKHNLLSLGNEFLTNMPVLSLIAKNNPITFSRTSGTTVQTLSIEIKSQEGTVIEYDLIDSQVLIELDHTFLDIRGETADIRYTDNISVYRYKTDIEGGGETVVASIPIRLKKFAQSTFNTYSVAGSNFVRTYIKVTGVNTGLTKTIEVRIS